jgi:hypothetical protein
MSTSWQIVSSSGLPRLTGPPGETWMLHQLDQAFDEVGDEAERARLVAVAEDRDVLAGQGLADQVGDDAAVLSRQPGAIGVEDPRHPHLGAAQAFEVEAQRLGRPLALVVAGARAGAVDVAPVGFDLRMDQGVAIDLAGRGLQQPGAVALGQAQQAVGAHNAGQHRVLRDRR